MTTDTDRGADKHYPRQPSFVEGGWQIQCQCGAICFAPEKADALATFADHYRAALSPTAQSEAGKRAKAVAEAVRANSKVALSTPTAQTEGSGLAEKVERAIELRRYLYGGEPLNANERGIVEGIRTAVLTALQSGEANNADQ